MSSDLHSKSKSAPDFEVRLEVQSEVQTRELLIIDDLQVREKYFAQAHDVLKKIDAMEERIQAFHSTDQRLFDQWYRLTFHEDQAVVDRSREELKQVARFHNWVVATALKLKIEMPQAYILMKEEERLWSVGNSEERKRIDADRDARDRYVSSQIHGRYNESHPHDSEDEPDAEILAQIGQVLSHLEILIFQQDYDHEPDLHGRIERISDLPDEEIQYWLKEQDASFMLFDLSLSWSESQNNYSFFRRIWSLMSGKQQTAFSEVYSQLSGRSMQELLDDIGSHDELKEDEDEDDLAFDFEDNQKSKKNSGGHDNVDPASRRSSAKGRAFFENEKLKSLYRKLVRKLHPDLQASRATSSTGSWTNKVWEMVQKAYHGEDVDGLQKLLKLTLLRSNSLDQLTLDEISDARKWLEKDLDKLETESQHLRLSPAWGFSQKKDYAPLSRQIEKDFRQMHNQVRFQIAEVRRELDLLEVLAAAELEFDFEAPSSKRAQSRSRSGRAQQRSHSRSQSRRPSPGGPRSETSGSKGRRFRDDLQDF